MDRDSRPDFTSTVMHARTAEVPPEPQGRRQPADVDRAPEEDDLRVLMSSETSTKTPEAAAAPPPGPRLSTSGLQQGHKRLLTRRDRIMLGFMAGVPTSCTWPWSGSPPSPPSCWPSPPGTASASARIKWVGLENFSSSSPTTRRSGRPCSTTSSGCRAHPGPDAVRPVPGRAAGQADPLQPRLPDRVLPAGRALAGGDRLHLAAGLQPGHGPDQQPHRGQPSRATTSTGSATRTSTCGPCWSPRPGGTPATS